MYKGKGGNLYNWNTLNEHFLEKGFAQNAFK